VSADFQLSDLGRAFLAGETAVDCVRNRSHRVVVVSLAGFVSVSFCLLSSPFVSFRRFREIAPVFFCLLFSPCLVRHGRKETEGDGIEEEETRTPARVGTYRPRVWKSAVATRLSIRDCGHPSEMRNRTQALFDCGFPTVAIPTV
jgi:hypothetical protein